MKFQTVSIKASKIIILMLAILVSVPFQAQNQKSKKKVVRTVPAKKKVVRAVPSRKYSHLPKRGAYIKVVPANARLIKYKSINYRFNNGIFYKPYKNQFEVAAAPIGIRIATLPIGYRTISIRNRPYFYYYGTYYVANGKEFEVVQAPVGALVESIPNGYEEVEIGGDTYYVVDRTQYKVVLHDAEIWYEVIKVG